MIAPQPFFSPRGTPLSVYYRALVLSEIGVRVDLLTYGQGVDVDLPGVRILRIPDLPVLGPVRIGPSLPKLLLDGLLLLRTVGLLARARYDFVHAHEETVFFCRFLKPVFRFKLVYDMHSVLSQQLLNFRFTRSRLLIKLFELLENSALAHADAVITISPALARHASQRIAKGRHHVLIENSIFEEVRLRVPPADVSTTAAAWQARIPADRPIIAYAGTFESYQGLDLLISAFARLLRARSDGHLLLIGGSAQQVERHQALAERLGVSDHILFTGSLPQPVTHRLLERADVLASPRSRGTNTPLKIYQALASGTPLVATRISAHTQVLDDSVCFLAEPDPASLAESLVAALSDRERRQQVTRAARALYEERYSRAIYERKLRGLLGALG